MAGDEKPYAQQLAEKNVTTVMVQANFGGYEIGKILEGKEAEKAIETDRHHLAVLHYYKPPAPAPASDPVSQPGSGE